MPIISEPELVFLLEGYQLRDAGLSEQFEHAVGPMLRRMAGKRSWGLPKDAIDDVVQEVFTALLNPDIARYDAQRGTSRQYLIGFVLNAIKKVQVGCGLRRTGTDFETQPQREYVPLEESVLPGSNSISLSAIYASQIVARIFNGFERDTEEACRRVWLDGEPQLSVAGDLNMSRFALARKMASVKMAFMQNAM